MKEFLGPLSMDHKIFHWKFSSKLHDFDKGKWYGPSMTLYEWAMFHFSHVCPIGSVLMALEQEDSRFTFLQI